MPAFTCPHCSQPLKLPENVADREGRCPRCREVLLVPAETKPAPASAGSPPPSPTALTAERVSPGAPPTPPGSTARAPAGAGRVTSGSTAAVAGVPGYEVLGELGWGGMGVVYRARHLALKRVVALKMVLAGEHAGSRERERFRREVEAVARLQHPNIVQIYEVGEHGGLPFCALEFVPGGSLADGPLPARGAAQVVESLANAMEAAPLAGIVHRDLKPANVLMTQAGEPKVTDFGLAKDLEDDSGHTRTGAVLGTPAYMAPEQAQGRTSEAGPLSDVYDLGTILCACLTGEAPFAGPMQVVLYNVAHQPAPSPRRMNPRCPRDLETICLKCLEKDPHRRYESAIELALDLRRFRRGEPIEARPVGLGERAVMWALRRPAWRPRRCWPCCCWGRGCWRPGRRCCGCGRRRRRRRPPPRRTRR